MRTATMQRMGLALLVLLATAGAGLAVMEARRRAEASSAAVDDPVVAAVQDQTPPPEGTVYIDPEAKPAEQPKRSGQAPPQAPKKPRDSVAAIGNFRSPEAFAEFCKRIHRRNVELNDLYRRLEHQQVVTTTELDKKGKRVAAERTTERVWFEGNDEKRAVVKRENLVTGKVDATPHAATTAPKATTVFPFSREEKPGMYRYSYEGTEKIGGRVMVKIRFEPNDPPTDKLRGVAWIDPTTYEPSRFAAATAQNPRFVDRVAMHFDFAPSEVGTVQLRHSVFEGSGGFAFIQKRYRIETEFSGYKRNEKLGATAASPTGGNTR